MEGKIYTTTTYPDPLSALREDGEFSQKRLSVPGADITIFEYLDEMRAMQGSSLPAHATDIRDVEVPDDLVEAAIKLIRQRVELNNMQKVFSSL